MSRWRLLASQRSYRCGVQPRSAISITYISALFKAQTVSGLTPAVRAMSAMVVVRYP